MTKPIFGFEDAREVISSRDHPCADASRSPLKLSFAEDLAALSAILKASPGYGKPSPVLSFETNTTPGLIEIANSYPGRRIGEVD